MSLKTTSEARSAWERQHRNTHKKEKKRPSDQNLERLESSEQFLRFTANKDKNAHKKTLSEENHRTSNKINPPFFTLTFPATAHLIEHHFLDRFLENQSTHQSYGSIKRFASVLYSSLYFSVHFPLEKQRMLHRITSLPKRISICFSEQVEHTQSNGV